MTRALVEWYLWWTLLKARSYKGYKLSVQSKGSCSSSQGTVCGAHAPHFEKMKLKYWKSGESSNKLPCPLHSITVPHLRENIYQTHQLPPAVPLLHHKFYYIAQEWHSAKVPKTNVWRHQRWLTSLRYDLTFLSWSGWSKMPWVDSCTDEASCVEHGRMKRLSDRQTTAWMLQYVHIHMFGYQ